MLVVSDIERAKLYYSEVLGCEVTDWWVLRDGFTGLAIKLLEARDQKDVRPNPPATGMEHGFDLYCYVENWRALGELYSEFKTKGAMIVIEPWVDENNGPWKEFVFCLQRSGWLMHRFWRDRRELITDRTEILRRNRKLITDRIEIQRRNRKLITDRTEIQRRNR